MGLTVSHGIGSWPYSGFHQFRVAVARLLGLPLDQMEGFKKSGGIPWRLLRPDPLWVLLCHSDCDGHIGPVQAGRLADRLKDLLEIYEEEIKGQQIGLMSLEDCLKDWIKGLYRANCRGEKVRFQ